MKKNNTFLITLWSAAIASLLLGCLLSIRAVGALGGTTEMWQKKTTDLQEMMTMRSLAAEHRSLLKHYAQYPATPPPLGELARNAVPGLTLITRSTETHPSVPGWTARKINIGLTDITGDDLGRFLEAVNSSTPPWAVLNCTLLASPVPGRLAQVELILETAEK